MNVTNSLVSHFGPLGELTAENHEHRRHNCHDMLVMALLATICGANTWIEINEFAEERIEWLKTFLELPNGIPSHQIFERFFGLINSETFEDFLSVWIDSLSIEAKTILGFYKKNKKNPLQLLNIWVSKNRVLFGQVQSKEKSNEKAALPELLELISVRDSIVTIDARGCQKASAKKIAMQGAHYVFVLEEDQKTLYADVTDVFEQGEEIQFKKIKHKQKVEKIRSDELKETRHYNLVSPCEQPLFEIYWPHINGIGLMDITRTINNETEYEKRFFLTSLDDGYQLLLLSELPKNSLPEKGKIYVTQYGPQQLIYIMQNPQGDKVDAIINVKIDDFDQTALTEARLRILAETAKKGHTIRDQDIDRFIQAAGKNWNVDINLHWSLDVHFQKDFMTIRAENAALGSVLLESA